MKFLTRERLTSYSRILVALYIACWTGWFVTGPDLLALHEKRVGSDFLTFYVGSRLSVSGDPSAAYDYPRFSTSAREIIGSNATLGQWLYPPVLAAIVMPFTYLPHLAALLAWLTLTIAAYLYVVGRTHRDRLTPWLAAAFLGTLANAMGGQNGFLSAAIIGIGFLNLRSAPFVGGVIFGVMIYKPQLALLIPIALLFGGHGRALLGFAAGVVATIGVSLAVVGWDGWLNFFTSIPVTQAMLEAGGRNWFRMPTAFVAARLLGADLLTAQICQLLVSAAAAATVAWVWWQPAPFALKAAALGVGSLLLSPFVFYYDWTVLVVSVAWLVQDLGRRGIPAWQVWTIVLAWFFPLFGPIIAHLTNLQLGPVILLAILAAVVSRVRNLQNARHAEIP